LAFRREGWPDLAIGASSRRGCDAAVVDIAVFTLSWPNNQKYAWILNERPDVFLDESALGTGQLRNDQDPRPVETNPLIPGRRPEMSGFRIRPWG